MRFSVLLLALVLTGCGARQDANIYGSLVGQNVVGNETYVSISNVWNEMDALPLATTHCSKYGKSARFTRMEPYRAIFDCVRT